MYNDDGVVTNEVLKIRDGFELINTDLWDIVQPPGDVVELGGNTAGSGYLKISKDPLTDDTETTLVSRFTVSGPFRAALAMSLSLRAVGSRFSFEFVSVDNNLQVEKNVPQPAPVAISSIQQATTTLTINTASPHGLVPGDRIVVYGVSDSRMNYGEVIVESAFTPTQITVLNFAYGSAIPSVTAGPFTSGYIRKEDPLASQDNVFSAIWEGTSANNVRVGTRSNKGPYLLSAQSSMGGNHTNAVAGISQTFADALQPAYTYDIRYKNEGIITRTFPVDTYTAAGGTIKRSQLIPDISKRYKIIVRAKNCKEMSRPVAKIASATKAGSTTATIVTDGPHGLTTGDQITIFGIRDQTNFANLTTATAVASIVDATTFTIAFGAAYTGTSYGGSVVKVNGNAPSNALTNVIQSITRTNNVITLVAATSFSGLNCGDTINLHGLKGSTGVDYTQYDGVYKVAGYSTSTLYLISVGPDFATINCGGAIFKRADLRLHFFRIFDYTRHTVDIDAGNGNSSDSQESLPVSIVYWSPIVGQTAHDAAVTGNPVRIGGRARNTNVNAVSSDDAADWVMTTVGAGVVKTFSIPELDWQYTGAAVTNTADVALKAAGSAGIRNYLTAIQVKNTSATATEIVIKDGSTVIWRGHVNASMGQTDYIEFPTPLKGTAATALNFACITGANVYVNAQGYQAP